MRVSVHSPHLTTLLPEVKHAMSSKRRSRRMRSATHPDVRTDEHLGRVTQVIAGGRDPLQRAQGGSNVGSLEARAV